MLNYTVRDWKSLKKLWTSWELPALIACQLSMLVVQLMIHARFAPTDTSYLPVALYSSSVRFAKEEPNTIWVQVIQTL